MRRKRTVSILTSDKRMLFIIEIVFYYLINVIVSRSEIFYLGLELFELFRIVNFSIFEYFFHLKFRET